MDKQFMRVGKDCIDHNDIDGLNNLTIDIQKHIKSAEYIINFQNIYQKLFLYACIKGYQECITYLFKLYFELFDDITKIALRQMFFYGKVLLKDKNTIKWYNNNIIPPIRAK